MKKKKLDEELEIEWEVFHITQGWAFNEMTSVQQTEQCGKTDKHIFLVRASKLKEHTGQRS